MLTFIFVGSNVKSNWGYSPGETNNNLFVVLWNDIMPWNKGINDLLLLVLFVLFNSCTYGIIWFLGMNYFKNDLLSNRLLDNF